MPPQQAFAGLTPRQNNPQPSAERSESIRATGTSLLPRWPHGASHPVAIPAGFHRRRSGG